MMFSAWYGIVIGLLMIAQWSFSIVTGDVPEFQTAPWAIGFHLAAEISTALMLVVGGIASLKLVSWSMPTLLVGLGMVIYSEIASPGYYAQAGQWLFVFMFAVILGEAVVSVVLALREKTWIN